MIYLYESHTGGYYISEQYNEEFLEECEMCRDSDYYVGIFNTMEEIAFFMFRNNAEEFHISEVTGLKVIVSFKNVGD